MKPNIVCKNCGSPIEKNAKFCSKCGTKNEYYQVPVEIDFTDQSLDEDVTSDTYKSFKISKLKYIGIIAAVVLICLLSFNALSKTFFPDAYVKSAFLNTSKTLVKENKEYNEIPGILSFLASSNDISEKELYIRLDGIDNYDLDYISNMLLGYGIKINAQNNLKDNKSHLSIGLIDNDSEIARADIFASPNNIAVKIPALYSGILGVRADSDIPEYENLDYDFQIIMRQISVMSKYINASAESKAILEEKAENLLKEIIELSDFKKADNSSGDTYITTINSNELIGIFKKHIIELTDEKPIRDLVIYTTYLDTMYYSSLEEVTHYTEEMLAAFPENLDYYLEEVNIDDIDLTVSVDKNKVINNLIIETKITNSYDETIRIKANYESGNNYLDSALNLKMYTEYDFVNIGASVTNSKKDNSMNNNITIKFTTSYDENLTVNINEEYDSSSKLCTSLIDFNVDSSYGTDTSFAFESKGTYNGKDKIDFDNLNIYLFEDGYSTNEYNFDLSGYIQNKKIKSVTEFNEKDITYIQNMSQDDINDLMYEIYTNFQIMFNEIY